ncbi:MAG: DUF3182 family protein [Stutzerimonas sp.]|uniref:DUF3182 family protein n=1 Tax=Stutzerimonas sp. TaxID=2901166 RepID=UPI003D0977D3
MSKEGSVRAPRGVVLTYPNRHHEPQHERSVHAALAERLADLLGYHYGGDYRPGTVPGGHIYLVPSGTIVGSQEARELGLEAETDLFGGFVPHPFVQTKAITHPLVRSEADAPVGWSRDFCAQVRDSVLPGYSAFTRDDARDAGLRLLHEGPVRIKPVRATGGRGQVEIHDVAALDQALAELDERELETYGLVLESNLAQVTTFSVGQVQVGDQLASYYGTQCLTPDNNGQQVYGGSDLVVVSGDFDALLRCDLDEATRLAVEQARVYDRAARSCFRGLVASRRNYDIARGMDARGRACSGVLEQSWRIGGASGAEIAALQALRADPDRVVHAATRELYGESQAIPPDAEVLFRGEDSEIGFVTKCVVVRHGSA